MELHRRARPRYALFDSAPRHHAGCPSTESNADPGRNGGTVAPLPRLQDAATRRIAAHALQAILGVVEIRDAS